jgi:peptidoglycan/LPS O-acetylase OafA/YrhL
MIALPLIVIARSLPRSRLDDLAGAIAYPLFLLHFGVLWLTSTVFENTTRLPALLTYLAITTALALMIATAVDMPLSRLRRRFRRHDSPIVSRPRTRLLLKK